MKKPGTIVSMEEHISVVEQTRALDWVHWLLHSVRQRCDGILIPRIDAKEDAHSVWRTFVTKSFEPKIGPALISAWDLMTTGDVERLLAQEKHWCDLLTEDEQERSASAGTVLLNRTQGARYQSTLGHYRDAVKAGRAEGHIGIVWPCVARLFQLSAATMLAEYVRLEWETATRDLRGVAMPVSSMTIASIVARVLRPQMETPAIVKRAKAG